MILFLAACGNGTVTPTPHRSTPESFTASPPTAIPSTPLPDPTASVTPTPPPPTRPPLPSFTPTPTMPFMAQSTLGKSTRGYPLELYRFGDGPSRLAVIGGIHGGYEWNTILLAYQLIDYFSSNPQALPPDITLYVIPAANPDGQVKVVGHAGRFAEAEVGPSTLPGRPNGDGVDLNRNWDCNWQPSAVWKNQTEDPGKAPFSEVETQLLRDFLSDPPLQAVIFFHSASGAVFAGGCGTTFAPSDDLAAIYAKGSGYPFKEGFTAYPVSGVSINWLAHAGIPAIEVELLNHHDLDWEQNLGGITAVLEYLQHGGK